MMSSPRNGSSRIIKSGVVDKGLRHLNPPFHSARDVRILSLNRETEPAEEIDGSGLCLRPWAWTKTRRPEQNIVDTVIHDAQPVSETPSWVGDRAFDRPLVDGQRAGVVAGGQHAGEVLCSSEFRLSVSLQVDQQSLEDEVCGCVV